MVEGRDHKPGLPGILLVALGVGIGVLVFPIFLLGSLWSRSSDGTHLDAARARRILAERPQLLAEIQSLPEWPGIAKDSMKGRNLARRIGALWIETEPRDGATSAIVCFEWHGGAGETYQERMQWFPPATVEHIRNGGLRAGEYWEELSGGWFWVYW